MIKVLFVCMGNICRSPLGEGIFRHEAILKGLVEGKDFLCSSAGTIGYHSGNPPDSRSQYIAKLNKIDISAQRSRKINQRDFDQYDYILAMDNENISNMKNICSPEHFPKISLLLDHNKETYPIEVPDPYYGGDKGFEECFTLVQRGVKGVLEKIVENHFPSKIEAT